MCGQEGESSPQEREHFVGFSGFEELSIFAAMPQKQTRKQVMSHRGLLSSDDL